MGETTTPAPAPAALAVSPTGTPVLPPGAWQPIAATVVGTLTAVPLVADQVGIALPPWFKLVTGLAGVIGLLLGIYSPGARKVPPPVNTLGDALNEAQKGPQP